MVFSKHFRLMAGTPSAQIRLFRFGPFELDVRAGELRKHGIRIKLREQPVQILLMLLEHPGEVVLREEIRLRLWPNNTIVEFDHSINAAIKKLRDALGESADEPRHVETVARRGYRFLGEVERTGDRAEPESAVPPQAADADPLVGSVIAHYRILNRLGEGGMGVVYCAEDLKLGRQVALKFLPEGDGELTESMFRRFAQEARAASALNHPNIVTIHDIANVEGRHFIVMEYVAGETLAARIARRDLRLPQNLNYAVQIAEALGRAHAAGIVHRDLKPSNIMIAGPESSGHPGTVKVLDFGLAKLAPDLGAAGEATATMLKTADGLVVGTAGYMSPEQVSNRAVDHRSDIFSFGLVLYEMLSGAPPFQGSSAVEVMNAILKEPPPELPDAVPPALRQIVAECLEKDPAARFDSARDLAFALRAVSVASTTGGEALKAATPVRAGGRRWLVPALAAAVIALSGLSAALYLMRPEPLDLSAYRFTPIALDPGLERFSSWSRDGKSIAYLKVIDGKDQVMVRNLDAPSPTQLTRLPYSVALNEPFFSPSGEQVYFIGDGGLWSVAVVGGEPRQVLKAPMNAATLSPDGKTLAFWRDYEEDGKRHGGVWISSPPGAPPRKYEPEPFRGNGDSDWLGVLRFSPDGSQIGLSAYRVRGEAWMWSLPWPDGPRARPRQIFSNRSFQWAASLDWMPDSRHLCLAFHEGLWLGDIRTGRLRRLTASAMGDAVQPAVSPGGERLMFTAIIRDSDIVEVPLDGSLPKPLLATARNESSPSWSSAGDAMAFITDRRGESEIWLRSADGYWERPVVRQTDFPNDPGRDFQSVALSPDGTRVVYFRHGSLWVSPASGRSALQAVAGNKGEISKPSWSPDSSSITYVTVIDSKSHVAITKVGSQQSPFIVPGTEDQCASSPVWSPDGRWIACGSQQSVLLVSPDGKQCRSLASPVRASTTRYVLVWSADAGTIYVASSRTPKARLDAIDARTGNTHLIAEYGGELAFGGPSAFTSSGSLSHDGRSFVTSVFNVKADLWMLEGFPQPWRRWF